MPPEQPLDDQRVKHLEMIQAVISRLATHGFLVKGWAVTVASVFFGFAVNSHDAMLALASTIPTLVFWGVDAYLLRSERLFRMLYDRVRISPTTIEPFFMGATSQAFISSTSGSSPSASSWWQTARRPTLLLLYGGLLVTAAAISLVLCG